MKDKADDNGLAARLFGSSLRARLLLVSTTLVIFAGGAIALWQLFGPSITAQQAGKYLVTAENVVAPDQPAWIQGDVKADVFREAGWKEQPPSILDGELTVKIAQAFELHTWVAQVTRVRKKHPARVEVELSYRRPIAMVEVDYQGQAGLLPVDAEGVLLPPDAFSADQARSFPRVAADYSSPGGPVGTPWGDRRVWGGAKVVAALESRWSEWNLYRVAAVEASARRARDEEPTFEVTTRDQRRILWGHAPGAEAHGEPPATEKVELLSQRLAAAGSQQVIDLRGARAARGGTGLSRGGGRLDTR